MTHRARLVGLVVAVLWCCAVGVGAICLLLAHQYDATIFACIVMLINMFLLLVYLWDTVRAIGFKEHETKRYKSEVDYLTAKVSDLEYARRRVYGVFKGINGMQRGELTSLHEVLFAAKAEARALNNKNKDAIRPLFEVYPVSINIKGDVA